MKNKAQKRDFPVDAALRGPGVWRSLREAFGGKRRLLDTMQLEVTSHCFGRCAYCPHSTMAGQWKARHLRPQTLVRLWPLLLETRRVHLQGWGEPFLHPNFLELVRLVRRADCLASTTTCGLIMNEGLAADLVDSGLDIIAFSITGSTKASNNAARAGLDFDAVLDSVRLLQDVRRRKSGVHLELHFAYLMLASAMDEVEELPELMRDLGLHAAVVSTLDYLPEQGWAREAFAPEDAEKTARAEKILQKAAARAAAFGMSIHYALPRQKAAADCLEHPARSVYVDAEGNLAPCIYSNLPIEQDAGQRHVFGSCHDQDPLTIRQGAAFNHFCRRLADGDPEEPCRNCPKRFAV
ncbi:radical SAM protein [Desulfovibrio sp. OttesenSCG-928-G11]|nr:radical SAM protein [Desulfovibrio sp. OttesenSCG-928-G11]